MHTLTHDATTVTLPSGLEWPDEFNWTDVVQTTTVLWGGGVVVQSARRLSGRQITLDGMATRVFVPRAEAAVLAGWLQTPGLTMVLSIHGGAGRTVVWDHERGGLAVSAIEVLRGVDPGDDDPCNVTLRFLEV